MREPDKEVVSSPLILAVSSLQPHTKFIKIPIYLNGNAATREGGYSPTYLGLLFSLNAVSPSTLSLDCVTCT